MLVYVLKQNGQPFMPTERFGKVRRLLKEGKAKVVRREPFTIRLLYEPETDVAQECYCGVDTGSKHIGVAVVGNDKILYQSQTELRSDIKRKMDARRQARRSRRSRKTRYRKCRFSNRRNSIRDGRLPPSVKHKVQAHIDEIEFCEKILPVSDLILEVSQFDTALMKNPALISEKVKHWGYQKGFNYGYSSRREAILHRDNYTCQCCGKKNCRLEVHHLLPRSRGGSDKLANLITLCSDCHHLAHSSEEQLLAFQKRFGKKAKGALRYATQMNILRSMLQKEYPDAEITYGFITKDVRRIFCLEKSHMVDACCIASMGSEFHNENSNKYKKKCVPKGNYARTGVKGGRFVFLPTGKISGFRRYDKVLYNNKEYFVTGRMSNGYITLTDIDGNKSQVESVKRSTGEKYLSLAKIKVSLVKKISSAKTCICTSV